MMPLLLLEGVSRSFQGPQGPFHAVRDVRLALSPGECVAITGRSGSGKSTLLNLIAGLDAPTSGRLLLDGIDLGALNDAGLTRLRREKIGLVFQFFNLLSTLTVRENVVLPGRLAGRNERELKSDANALLQAMDLSPRADATPETLSGGEMQRCAVARALIHRPRLLLADEPTGNLDTRSAEQVLDLMLTLPRERGTAVLIVTHSAEVAARADRQLVMRDGVLRPEGVPGE
ncbi:MAG: ABC transporter ATP-binding protein [Armatimonadetes bacterium]|nr:ABC transporter ATP-binding protein [Armatimonadota bacterium]